MREIPMPREQAFTRRTSYLYATMKKRFGPRLWKSGKRKGLVRVIGQDIPFSLEDFRAWFSHSLGGRDAAVKCRYCPGFISALDASVDHVHPISQGGGLGLDNLALCCLPCNKLKGGLSEYGFLSLMSFVRSIGGSLTIADSQDIERRLRGGIVYHKTKKLKIAA